MQKRVKYLCKRPAKPLNALLCESMFWFLTAIFGLQDEIRQYRFSLMANVRYLLRLFAGLAIENERGHIALR